MSKPSEERCVCKSHVSLGLSHAWIGILDWMTRSGREKGTCDFSTAGEGRVRQIEGTAEQRPVQGRMTPNAVQRPSHHTIADGVM